jgi:hypothetical protein
MKYLFIGCLLSFVAFNYIEAQSTIKLDFISKVPAAIKSCGALYTYDTTKFTKKKFILVVDFQNKGLITVAGKQIPLTLTETKLVGKATNVTTYNGAGYTIVLSTKTIKQTTKIDTEEGTVTVTKGKDKVTLKIHGQSGCDSSKEEGN